MAKIKGVIRGDTRVINIQVNDTTGAPIDITGYEFFFTVNTNADPQTDSGAAIEKTWSNHVDPTNGLTQTILTNADTQNVDAGTYFYDVQFKDNSGNITSTIQDQFVVIADITRRIS